MTRRIGRFIFEETGPGTAYLKLPTHPGELRGARAVPLADVMGQYAGPYIVFDFDPGGVLVGIEIISEEGEENTEE